MANVVTLSADVHRFDPDRIKPYNITLVSPQRTQINLGASV